MQKDPAADRSLAVSKDDYAQMLTKETPFEGTRGQLPWHLYTPAQAAANPSELFPLIVVLHGGYGREVTDGNIMVDVAQYLLGSQNGLLTEANRADYPAYIVLPHCRVEEGCSFGTNEWASAGGAHYQIQAEPSVAGGTALELVEHVIDTYAVDPTRVYLTGNSMGGGGSWEFASRRPELFAAVLPVSGHPPALEFLTAITDAKLPVWAFGAENDTTNPYPDTVEAIDTIDTGGGCAWLTTYNGTGHDDALWSSPYLEPGLWSWLFSQSNSSAPR
jgi:predicted peptidase